MNNLKKIGLTALAGSLVASTAYAGSLSVSGSAAVKYQSKGSERVTGNPFSDSNGITFSGSGDLENGMTVGVSYTMTDAAFSTSNVTLDMGDTGKLAFGHDSAHGGIDTIKDMMPTAGEQVYDDVDATDEGVTDVGADPSLYYSITMDGITASASYARTGLGTDNSLAVVANDMIEGASFGVGIGTNAISDTSEDDMTTIFATYATGPITVGYQTSEADGATTTQDDDSTSFGISYAVTDDLSVSYGEHSLDLGSSTSDQESEGFSASYTMGGTSIKAAFNETVSVGGVNGTDREGYEIALVFAF